MDMVFRLGRIRETKKVRLLSGSNCRWDRTRPSKKAQFSYNQKQVDSIQHKTQNFFSRNPITEQQEFLAGGNRDEREQAKSNKEEVAQVKEIGV